jgi:predicted ATP-grasp superfamily ATP-dependent carboligase
LVKPRAGAGGVGISFRESTQILGRAGKRRLYTQEFIEGDSCSAVFAGDDGTAQLLGVTRQLVGEPWLHAAAFRYCGSVGPLPLPDSTRTAFEELGNVLAAGFDLRGLFGVDCILKDGRPWPVEVNPRYTASVEVLELALGIPALAWHRRIFEPGAQGARTARAEDRASSSLATDHCPLSTILGKAILFAPHRLVFPATGPWQASLDQAASPWSLPLFADIPHRDEIIPAGRPILSFFARSNSLNGCLNELRHIAAGLGRALGLS